MAIREELVLDLSSALDQIDELERQLDGLIQPIEIPVTVTGEEAIAGLRRQIDAAESDDIDVDVNVDGIDAAADEFGDLRREIGRTEDAVEDLDRETEQTTQGVLRLGTQGASVFTNLRGSVTGVIAAFGAVQGVRAFIGFAQDAVGAASDLDESVSKARVVFGAFNDDIQAFAATAPQALGLSTQAALEFAGTFGNLFVALGLTQEAAAELAPEIVQLGSDLASFNNIEVTDALDKLRAGLVGEAEPLRALGVNLTAATTEAKAFQLGLQDANGELTEAAKVQARYALILEQTGTAQGDFARTSEGLANQTRTFAGELENARAAMGAGLVPAVQAALPILTDLVGLISVLAIDVAELAGTLPDAEAALARIAAQSGGSVDSVEALAVAVLQASTEAERFGSNDRFESFGDRTEDLTEQVEALVDAWGGGETEIQQLIDILPRLRSQYGLTEDAAKTLGDALTDKLGDAAVELSDDVLRARVQNEVRRTGQAMLAAAAEAKNYEEAMRIKLSADITRTSDELERQQGALAGLRQAADEAGVPLGELLGDIEALPPELQVLVGSLSEAQLALAQTEGIDRFKETLDELPGAMAAAADAFRDETGEIETDFDEFLENLSDRLASQRAFQTNLDILRAFGLDNLASAFEAEGIEAAELLTDALSDPSKLAAAERELEADYVQLGEGLGETLTETLRSQNYTPAMVQAIEDALANVPPEARDSVLAVAEALSADFILVPELADASDVVIPPNYVEGIDVGTVTIPAQIARPSGGTTGGVSPGVTEGLSTNGGNVNVTINNPTTKDLDADAARAAQEVGAVVRNLPQ